MIGAWLFTISFIFTNYWKRDSSPEKVRKKLETRFHNAENEIEQLAKDTPTLKKLLANKPHPGKLTLQTKQYGVFLYSLNKDSLPSLQYWNSNVFTISAADLQQPDGYNFVVRQNGEQEIIRKSISLGGQDSLLLMAVIPLHWEYFINNKYLRKDFDGFPSLDEQYEISEASGALPILNSRGLLLFKIKQKTGHIYAGYDWLTIILRGFSMLLLAIFVNRFATDIHKQYDLPTAMFFLISVIVFIRFITYHFPFPFDFTRLSLFDPSVYASNALHPSLGHLAINAILLFWVAGFYKFNSLAYRPSPLMVKYPLLRFGNLVSLVAVVFSIVSITSSLVLDSKISFDVTNFFSLNRFSVVGFMCLSFLVLALYHISHILLRPLFAIFTPLSLQLLVAAVTGLLYVSIFNSAHPLLNIFIILWILGYLVMLNYRKADIHLSIRQSSIFIFWVIYFALSATFLISHENLTVDIAERKKMAERLVIQNDANGENAINIAVSNINLRLLKNNFYQFYTEYANKHSKDSILNENFIGYLNHFETSVYTYDSLYQGLFNEDTTVAYADLFTVMTVYGKRTNIPDLYSYAGSDGKANYLYFITICIANKPSGYFFLQIKPKKYKSEALYPVLFSQDGDEGNRPEGQKKYPYAIYNNGKLSNKINEYDFPIHINTNELSAFAYSNHINGSTSELWYNVGNGKTIIIAKPDNRLVEMLTLFAYLFFTFLVTIGIFHVVGSILDTHNLFTLLRKRIRLNMRTQIHATVIFISVASFVIIGYTSIQFFTNRFNTSNRQRLFTTIEMIANELAGNVGHLPIAGTLHKDSTIEKLGYENELEWKIATISEIHNVDINYYSPDGRLLATTQPHIYNKQLLNNRINPSAFFHLKYDERNQFVQTEKIGKLGFLSIYMPIVNEKGQVEALLNIPYLNSQVELNQEISNFMATIINLNAFIFLIAGAIAFLLTQRVVASFSIIADKMKEIGFGKKNEAIVWNKNDEISDLVKEYNKMVQKLEQSAEALARSEREGAWREMARQVAHEIKNPLTPMKLSIQYLQRAIDNDQPNAKQLAQNVAKTLVDQIDQLARIAGDFSQFANINNVQLEELNISQIIENVTALYSQGGSASIFYSRQPDVWIMGDKTQLNRLFTNLIKNAIEATPDDITPTITLTQSQTSREVTIAIKDNGKGISPDQAQHIFQPNFTTKTSGTGLGLAICKGIVENLRGSITFSTGQGKGTTFFIILPRKSVFLTPP